MWLKELGTSHSTLFEETESTERGTLILECSLRKATTELVEAAAGKKRLRQPKDHAAGSSSAPPAHFK